MNKGSLIRLTASAERDGSPDYGEFVPRFFVGGLAAADHLDQVVGEGGHGVTHLITFAARLANELDVPASVTHTVVEIDDHPMADLLSALPRALEAMDAALAAQAGCLVHCASGVSRSVAACAAWLMTRRGETLNRALAMLRSVRPHANPNPGFKVALGALESSGGDIGRALAEWKRACGSDMLESLRAQREKANELHAEVDALEERVAKGERSAVLLAALRGAQDKVDGQAGGGGLDDRVARVVRRSAGQKVARLIESCVEE